MRIAYFDCFSGISGDMTLGALVDAGADIAMLRAELAKLPVTGYRLEANVVKRCGLRGTKVDVLVEEPQPLRKYTDIVAMISASDLDAAVQKDALEIFRRLGEAEAHLHNEPLEMVHFHEVGAVDSIVDVVGAVIGLHVLEVSTILSSPVNVGFGTVRTAHGLRGGPDGNDHPHWGSHCEHSGKPFWGVSADAGRKGGVRRRTPRPAKHAEPAAPDRGRDRGARSGSRA
jgi:uncharacterized protein (DUF111 family)